jgi:hypothetical protein
MKNCRSFGCALVLLCASATSVWGAELLKLSIPAVALDPGERVVGFQIQLKGAAVRRITNVPVGWSLSIDNDASWNTNLKATVQVGAAALGADFLRDFVTVEKNEFGDLTFDANVVVAVTKDFVRERKIVLKRQQLQIAPQ